MDLLRAVMDFNADIDDLFQEQPDIANPVNNFFNFNTFYNEKDMEGNRTCSLTSGPIV